jgi:flagellar basal-body rod protein FlgC
MAYGKKMAIHADNIANMNSEGFQKSDAIITQSHDQNVSIERQPVEPFIRPISGAEPTEEIQNNSNDVDLAEEIVGLEISQTGYDANLAVIKTVDEMEGSLLDVIG